MTQETRPPFIKHFSEIQEPDDAHYPESEELLSIGAPFSKHFGMTKIGVHHEVLPPGRRTSYPHAESAEEEFVYVIEGTPDAWIDGVLHRLQPGDGVGFPAGTGIAHCFINNSDDFVRLLVIGERDKSYNRIFYPLNPELKKRKGWRWWDDVPARERGPHNGKPD